MKKLITIVGLCVANLANAAKVPEKRNFPLSKKIKACDNFYGYVCSEVVDNFTLPADKSKYVFSFTDSYERLLEKKKTYLSNLAKKKNLSKRSLQMKNTYLACMNEKARAVEEKSYVAAYVNMMRKVRNHKDFLALQNKMRAQGAYSYLYFGDIANQDNSDYKDLYFMTDLLTLPEKTYYEDDKIVAALEDLYASFFSEIKYGDNPKKLAAKVVTFEKKFAKDYPLARDFRELFSKKMLVSKNSLLKTYPNLGLDQELQKLDAKTKVRSITPKSYAELDKQMMSGNLETMKAHYLYHALSGDMDDAYKQYYKKKFDFKKKYLGGPEKRSERNKRCTELVMGRFGKELDYELIDVLFPKFDSEKVVKLAEKVRQSIVEGIKSNNWLSKAGKKGAIEKISSAKLHLVKPDRLEDWDFKPLAEYSPTNPINNDLVLSKKLRTKMFAELAEKRNKNKWWMSPLTVNAYYSPSDNKFVLPQGILQYPFFDQTISDVANLGAMGVVVGHELGHGIDDKGAKYDAKGGLNQWMSDEDLENFKKRGFFLVDQFDKVGHDGKLTLGENIGDLTGLTFAYNAAFAKEKASRKEKQDFFIQYARLWCGKIRDVYVKKLLKTDPHALGWERVNQQVIHQDGFYEAFSCKKQDKMYIEKSKRIKIW